MVPIPYDYSYYSCILFLIILFIRDIFMVSIPYKNEKSISVNETIISP